MQSICLVVKFGIISVKVMFWFLLGDYFNNKVALRVLLRELSGFFLLSIVLIREG